MNKIKTDYSDDKDLNQVKTNYKDNKDNIEIETHYESNEDDIEIETNYGNDKENIVLEVATCRNLLLLYLSSTNILDSSNEIASIAKFDIIQSSLSTNPMAISPSFLISTTN